MVVSNDPNGSSLAMGAHGYSASHVLVGQSLGAHKVNLGVYALDVEGVPLLVGVKTLRKLAAAKIPERCDRVRSSRSAPKAPFPP